MDRYFLELAWPKIYQGARYRWRTRLQRTRNRRLESLLIILADVAIGLTSAGMGRDTNPEADLIGLPSA